jgi:hypothetical protein
MNTSKTIIDYLIADIDSHYNPTVSQSVINRNGGDVTQMGSIEFEQTFDDLLSIANERD